MHQDTPRLEDVPRMIAELFGEVKDLRKLFEEKIQHMAPKEPPVKRKVVMQRLGTTAPTLLALERSGKITKYRNGRIALYDFQEVVGALKKPINKTR